MKRLKGLILTLLLVVFGCGMTALAEEPQDDTLIQWTVNDSQSGAALSLAPTEDMVENAATTLQITLQIADTFGQMCRCHLMMLF